MREKLYGALIPEVIVGRLERVADPRAEGRKICVDLMRELLETPGIAGVHVMAPQDHAGLAEVIGTSAVGGKKRAASQVAR
jgi:methylenetetrahydrofolate reductase (NADPH)